MMNLGDVKGKDYQAILRTYKCQTGLELGTYIGYSALLAIQAMLEHTDTPSLICLDNKEETNKILFLLTSKLFILLLNSISIKPGPLLNSGKQTDEITYDINKIDGI